MPVFLYKTARESKSRRGDDSRPTLVPSRLEILYNSRGEFSLRMNLDEILRVKPDGMGWPIRVYCRMEEVKSTIDETTERAGRGWQETRDKLKSFGSDAAVKAKEMAKAHDTYVRENPWAVIGIVAAATAVVAFLIGRSTAEES